MVSVSRSELNCQNRPCGKAFELHIGMYCTVSFPGITRVGCGWRRESSPARAPRLQWPGTRPSTSCGFVGEVRSQPAFDLFERLSFAPRIAGVFFYSDAAHREVAR